MSKVDDCTEKLSEKFSKLDKAEIRRAAKRIDELSKRIEKSNRKLSQAQKDEILSGEIDKYIKIVKGQQLQKIKAQKLTVHRASVLDSMSDRKDKLRVAATHLDGSLGYVKGGSASAYRLSHVKANEIISSLESDLRRAELWNHAVSARDPLEKRVFAFMFDKKLKPKDRLDKVAKGIADSYGRANKSVISMLQRSGSMIGELEDYVQRTVHDAAKMKKHGEANWIKDMMGFMDRERVYPGMSDEDIVSDLKRIYDEKINGVIESDDLEFDPFDSKPDFRSIDSVLSRSRKFHFKSSDALFEYSKKYGRGRLLDNIVHSVERAANKSALMDVYGVNVKAAIKRDIAHLAKTRKDFSPSDVSSIESDMDIALSFMDGRATRPGTKARAMILGTERALATLALLGNAGIRGMSDIAFAITGARSFGVNPMRAALGLVRNFMSTVPADDYVKFANSFKIASHHLVTSHMSKITSDAAPGVLSSMMRLNYKINLMDFQITRSKMSSTLFFSEELASRASHRFGDLDHKTRALLQNFGIDEKDWDLFRKFGLEELKGSKYLTPGAMFENAAESLSEANRRSISQKFSMMFSDYADAASPTPGLLDRSTFFRIFGTRSIDPDSWTGQAARSLQFLKSFPVTAVRVGKDSYLKSIDLNGNVSAISGMRALSQMMVWATVMAYVADSIVEVANGREPRDPTDPNTVLDAFLKGGAAGIYADIIAGAFHNQNGKVEMAAALSSPTIQSIEDIAEMAIKIKNGENAWPKAVRLAERHTPYQNVFWLSRGVDRLIFDSWKNMADPAHGRKTRQRLREQPGIFHDRREELF